MKFIELFAGIGGFRIGLEAVQDPVRLQRGEYKTKNTRRNKNAGVESVGTKRLGNFTCVWANEIDKYACQIYRRNYGTPDNTETRGCGQEKSVSKQGGGNIGGKSDKRQHTISYLCPELYEGDITKVKTGDIPDHDLLCAGFPCQAFSIAGKRDGFNDTRGTLFFEIVRIAREKQPRLLLLENVRGLLSHKRGRTFATILSTLDEIGYDLQWEVLNSKNFGVPQNRERVFIVGHLRGTSRPEVFPIGNANKENNEKPISTALDANYWKGIDNHGQRTAIVYSYPHGGFAGGKKKLPNLRAHSGAIHNEVILPEIRRLTPTECERLQGFPGGWTEGVSDTQRYKCLGNAVTTTVISEIGKRLIGGSK